MTTNAYESFARPGDAPRASERSFGFVFTAVFAVIGLWPLLGGGAVRWWSIAVAMIFLVLAIVAPKVLAPLNTAWMAIGRLLHKIVSPVVLGLLYAVAVVPTGFYLRLRGLDPLRLKYDRTAKSYWQPRTPPGPAADSFKNQF